MENMSTMNTFNNNFNAPGDPPKCLQSVAESFRAQDRAHLAAWPELREVYYQLQLPAGCSGM